MKVENKINLTYRFLSEPNEKMSVDDADFIIEFNRMLLDSYDKILKAENHKINTIKLLKRYLTAQRNAMIKIYKLNPILVIESDNIIQEFKVGEGGLEELKVFKV